MDPVFPISLPEARFAPTRMNRGLLGYLSFRAGSDYMLSPIINIFNPIRLRLGSLK